ncbi:D-alanine--D-alanine ligase family protein [Agrococcus sp. SGAir0287]|uniref:D-alanine--D-alanine ligase family protein n=1 Tax=Agrococcus sp. SGAir0287 TaxID=2070347 RepID=UPI0010CD57EF|nr:ATP-grasp domain-containing protein [Agrococcus sp. SGAir0287]QCR19423.1 D-alanine--D-alanine ligase [Agrococcus sp. SGAir0287]
MRVMVVGGGISHEHDVSLASAAAVADALASRHAVVRATIAHDGTWRVDGEPLAPAALVDALAAVDVVFPALHGAGGEDGALQGFLATLGVPFVGCGVEASAVCMRKDVTKAVLAAHGVATVEGRVVATPAEADAAVAALGAPVVVKPLADGSSVGLRVACTVEEVRAACADGPMLVERYAGGMEVDVAIVELDGVLRIGSPLEIVREVGGVFDASAKYGGEPPFVVPARLPPAVRERLEGESLRVFAALGCRGLARVDWFVDGDKLVCNEVNTMPGMTARSQLPRMLADVGVPFEDLVDGLVRGATG